MWTVLKNIWLGVALILVAALLLLYSDLDRREGGRSRSASAPLPRIAVLQWVSSELLDSVVVGIVDGLRQQGYEHNHTAHIRFFNASGDTATCNILARDLVGGAYDMVVTASTLALQAVAKANEHRRVTHVFGGVTNPFDAGVGITGPAPGQRPPHLVGVGTFQPVARAIELAREMNPDLGAIGVVWNPGESNSEACVLEARKICRMLDIVLLEANAGTTSETPEAVQSLIARGSQAIWVGGDTVAISSLAALVMAANAAKIPVFTNDPTDTDRGVLFGVGAAYHEVGAAVGSIAGEILNGVAPESYGIDNFVPEVLAVNEAIAARFDGWTISDDIRSLARSGRLAAQAPSGISPGAIPLEVAPVEALRAPVMHDAPSPALNRPWEIRVIRYNDAQFSEDTWRGIMDGLKNEGLHEGRDFNIRCLSAQGDMTTLVSIVTAASAERPDLLMAISTPALQAALKHGDGLPLVFSSVGDGVLAGAGASETDHLPHVTGITTRSPFDAMARLIKESIPGVRAVGTLFSPAEINSELYREWFAQALEQEGIALRVMPVSSSADTTEATTALLRKDIQVLAQIADNTTRPGYPQIIKRASEANIPFFCFDSAGMKAGATLALARDYYDSGVKSAAVAVRVLRGESPRDIPFANLSEEVLAVNLSLLRKHGIHLAPEWMQQAHIIDGEEP